MREFRFLVELFLLKWPHFRCQSTWLALLYFPIHDVTLWVHRRHLFSSFWFWCSDLPFVLITNTWAFVSDLRIMKVISMTVCFACVHLSMFCTLKRVYLRLASRLFVPVLRRWWRASNAIIHFAFQNEKMLKQAYNGTLANSFAVV